MDQLRERYTRLNGERPVGSHQLHLIEQALGLSLPPDFRDACAFFDGSGCGGFFHNVGPTVEPNIVNETVRLRESINLPRKYLVLGEPPISLLVLDCESGSVMWCDSYDAGRLATGKKMHEPTLWPNFSDCLSYVLDQEEEERSGS